MAVAELGWGHAVCCSKDPNHVRGGGETALLGDVFDGLIGAPKQCADGIQPLREESTVGRAAELPLEDHLEG